MKNWFESLQGKKNYITLLTIYFTIFFSKKTSNMRVLHIFALLRKIIAVKKILNKDFIFGIPLKERHSLYNINSTLYA
jgi:hypothetical protein